MQHTIEVQNWAQVFVIDRSIASHHGLSRALREDCAVGSKSNDIEIGLSDAPAQNAPTRMVSNAGAISRLHKPAQVSSEAALDVSDITMFG